MEDNKLRNMNDICRLCLKSNGTIIPIFGRENSSRDCVPLSKKILACVSIEVKDEGGLPKMICVSCVHHIDSWCRFKETCDDSQKKLNWLQAENTVPSNEAKCSANQELRNIDEVVILTETSDDDDDDDNNDIDSDDGNGGDEVIVLDSDDDSPQEDNIENTTSLSDKHVLNSETVATAEKHEENTEEHEPLLCDKPDVHTDTDKNSSVTENSVNDILLFQKSVCHEKEREKLNETPQTTESVSQIKLTDPVENRNILKSILLSDNTKCNADSDSSDKTSREQPNQTCVVDISSADSVSVNDDTCGKKLSGINVVEKITFEENSDVQQNLADANGKSVSSQENSDSQKNSCTDTPYQNTDLVIEGITTLTGKERTVFSESSSNDCELTVQNSLQRNISKRTWRDVDDGGIQRQSNNSDHGVVNSETDYAASSVAEISAVDIKEEPLDEDEVLVEEDPLSFASFYIKKEPQDWSENNDTENLNPDMSRADDTVYNQNFSPKVLNSGELFCEPCQRTQSNFSNWVRHCRTRIHKRRTKSGVVVEKPTSRLQGGENQTQAFQCHLCPCVFGYQQNLKRHIREKHDPNSVSQNFVSNGDYACSQCPKSFDTSKALRGHTLFAHSDSRYCTCEKCKLEFPSLSALLTHKRSCGKRGFITKRCTKCSKVFTTSKLFLKHLRFCKQTFYKEINTNIPALKHVKPSPQTSMVQKSKSLACTLCDISFQQYSTLVKHMNMYHFGYSENKDDNEINSDGNKGNSTTDNDEFSCKYCPQSFNSRKAYVSHVTQHVRKQEFDCKFCGYQSNSKQMFRHHVKTVHFSQFGHNFLCWICFTPFGTKSEFYTHKLQHKKVEKIKIYSCNICNNSFSSISAIAKHKRIVHGDESAFTENDNEIRKNANNTDNSRFNTQCKICKKFYSTVGNLNRHVLLHKRKVTSVSSVGSIHRCMDCFRVYSSATGLKFHKKFCKKKSKVLVTSNYKIAVPTYHSALTKGGRVKCNKCDRMFASNAILYKHKFLKRCPLFPIERYGKNIACVNCDRQFPSSISLRRHCKNCSTDERNCKLCGEVFSSVFVLSEHKSICSGSQLKCTVCGSLLPSVEELREHKRTCSLQLTPSGRTANIFHCTHCNKGFKYSKCFKEHEIKCASILKKCLNCQRKFISSAELQKHKLTCFVTQEFNSSNTSDKGALDKIYCKCSVCNESFSNLEDFENHPCQKLPDIKLEPSNETYSCDVCLQQFTSMSYLNRHIKFNHAGHQKNFKVDEPKRYICPLCPNIIFHKQQGYLEHRERQHKEKPKVVDSLMNHGEKLTCELCDQQFTDETIYQQHMEDHISPSGNSESEQFRCDLCDKQFATYKSVLSHRAGHFKGKNFSEETATSSSSLNVIKRTQFRCDLCNKQFGTYKSVISHRAGHFRTKSLRKLELTGIHKKLDKLKIKHVRCKVCDKLLSVHSMKKHKKIHMREEYYAMQNQAASLTDYYPKNNESSHGSDKANGIPTLFQCIECGKSFKYRKMLIEHMKVHLDQSKLEGGSYNDEASESTLTSSNSEAYYCKCCDLSWRHKSNYLRHIITKKHKILEAQFSNDI